MITQEISVAQSSSYFQYATEICLERSLPDVRDGLKPVQRRILFGAQSAGMGATGKFRKSAKMVGEVLSATHPHGDTAVFDAGVRLGQSWINREPLMVLQGNKGSIADPKSFAAMRYLEMKMSHLSAKFLKELDPSVVPYVPNFDNSLMQPALLPVTLPNMLINGATGIAAGYAGNFLPHNPTDVVELFKAYIDNKDIHIDDMISILQAPDFPTGGIITNGSDLAEAYRTGNGTVKIRSKYEILDVGRSKVISFTEIPYLKNTDSIIDSIGDLVRNEVGCLKESIRDLKDETSSKDKKTGVTFVTLNVYLKQGADPQRVVSDLFKHTSLASNTTFNMNGVTEVNGKSVVKLFNLKDLVEEFYNFRFSVIKKGYLNELSLLNKRLHILEGLDKVSEGDNLTEVIDIIRSSEDEIIAAKEIADRFELTSKQAESICAMKLSRLTNLGVTKLKLEISEKQERVNQIIAIVSNPDVIDQVIIDRMEESLSVCISPKQRLTEITDLNPLEEQNIPAGRSLISLSDDGFISRLSADEFSIQKRNGKGKTLKGGKIPIKTEFVDNHDKLFCFTTHGRVCFSVAGMIAATKLGKLGVHVNSIFNLNEGEEVVDFVSLPSDATEGYMLIATDLGLIKKTKISEYVNSARKILLAIDLNENDTVAAAMYVPEEQEFCVNTSDGMTGRINTSDITTTKRDTKGSIGISLRNEDFVISMFAVQDTDNIISISTSGLGKTSELVDFPLKRRTTTGVQTMLLKEDTFCVFVGSVDEDDDLLVITDQGKTIRISSAEIPALTRRTYGSKVIKLDDDDSVVSVSVIKN